MIDTLSRMDIAVICVLAAGCAMVMRIFWLMSVWIGSIFQQNIRLEFDFILGGVMTLLALIIGFTFAMAVNRYDQRKNYEAEEANAIGTEYLRLSLLPKDDAARVQALLRNYLDQRILTYTTRDRGQLRQINLETARLQSDMWTAVEANAQAQPTPVASFIAAGMNDVLSSQGYTEAAWRNRIPIAAWTLVLALSIFCNFLVGYGVHGRNAVLALALPIAVSISLLLIADIDSRDTDLFRCNHTISRASSNLYTYSLARCSTARTVWHELKRVTLIRLDRSVRRCCSPA